MKRSLVVTTCGTSVLSNDGEAPLRALLSRHANARSEAQLSPEAQQQVRRHLEQRRAALLSATQEQARSLSAEINGIVSLMDESGPGATMQHVLIASDTYLGQQTAQLIQAWLLSQGHGVTCVTFGGLRTDDLMSFRGAISELVKWAGSEDVQGYRARGYQVVFHLTGGFKSVNGFMQSLGMLYADEVVYLFEGQRQLLRIPKLPMELRLEPVVRAQLSSFRRMGELELTLPAQQCEGIPQTLLMEVDGRCALSIWGQAVWEQVRATLYREQIWGSAQELVVCSEEALADMRRHHSRYETLNERLDDLARFAQARARGEGDGNKHNVRRLDFKALRGAGHKGATHECDAWSGHGGLRLFCRVDGPTILVDRLAPGLH